MRTIDREIPVLINGINFRAMVRWSDGDWTDYEIQGVYPESGDQDIYDLIIDGGDRWELPLNDQVSEYMYSQEWRCLA